MATSCLFIIARDLHERGKLQGWCGRYPDEQLGLELALAGSFGIPFVRANVGDRYVIAELLERDWLVGGENSGHVVCSSTPPPVTRSLPRCRCCGCSSSPRGAWLEARQALRKCPQVLLNVRFGGGVDPIEHPAVKEACERVTAGNGGRGRVLLRKSGTEPLVRVMVEGEDEVQVRGYAEELAEVGY